MSSGGADERPRVGREATREALIEATAQIMLDEGYAAATSRRVAAKAGVKPALHQTLPRTLRNAVTGAPVSPNIVVQSGGGSISCRTTVDGVLKDERTSDGVNAQTFCLVKSA